MTRRRDAAAALALGKRDLRRYFNNPTGYVFITLFMLLSAAAAFWRPRFFLNSLANLDQLNEVYPYLLLFFVPTIAMNLWSDERKQGTDELLLTLPARERSLIAGKYLAAAGIYSVALAVSISHALVLAWLGRPDWGLVASTYLGFWLLGMALIPVAMLASLLTANATIAFILGALLCAIPVGIPHAAATASDALARRIEPFTVVPYFTDFTRGIAGVSALLYFTSLAGVFLYVDVAILEHRSWRRRMRPLPMPGHVAIRATALAVACASVVILAGRTRARLDLTADRLYSLSTDTRALLAALPADRQLLVEAFISPDLPQVLVQTRENLLGTLREIEARAGARVTVTVHDTEAYSEQARLARERYGIVPRRVFDLSTGDAAREVYLGIAVTDGAEEDVVPFMERGLSPEYEAARAIRLVSRAKRKRIGIIDTDVKMLGGIDYQRNEAHSAWRAVQELRKEYDVIEVTPASAAEARVDALLVVMPSRMTQTDLDLAMAPARRGVPTLLLVDPLPMMDVRLAPAADLARQIDPYRREPSARLIFGNIRRALEEVGINWVPARIAWDAFNPHPDMADLPQETVFVSHGNGNPNAFNRANPATARLQEVMFLYPGYLLPAKNADVTFEPLLQTGTVSGSSSFFDLVVPTRDGMLVNANASRESDHRQYTLAARVRSKQPMVSTSGARPVDVIAIADIDFISDYFFSVRDSGSATFDNITLFLNSIDLLAGDDAFIRLRNRFSRHRTLERLEAQTRTFVDRRTREEQGAEQEARTALEETRTRLNSRVDELNARNDLDVQARQMMVRNLEETEKRRLRVVETTITAAKDAKIRASRETMETAVRNIRTRIRVLAVLLPPMPMLLAGVAIFIRRTRRERESARILRRLVEST